MKKHHKWVMKNQKNGNLNTQIERYFVIKIKPFLKMQKKTRGVSVDNFLRPLILLL